MMARRKPESGPCHDENPRGGRGGVGAYRNQNDVTRFDRNSHSPSSIRRLARTPTRRHADTSVPRGKIILHLGSTS
jgi:hypothetical protein